MTGFERCRAVGAGVLLLGLAAILAGAQEQSGAKPAAAPGASGAQELRTGVVLSQVQIAGDAGQSYALYLPSGYTPAKRWPVIYAFDPDGRGRVPVELLEKAAELRGTIVAGSNVSRNGPVKDEMQAAEAMWRDTHARLSIDGQQVYAAGFSGGARAAFTFALQCGCVQGVIAAGAGLPAFSKSPRSLPVVVFATLGEYDFNYPELVTLEQKLDKMQVPNRLRRFDGGHQWAPTTVLAEAVDWLQLEAMRQRRRAKDDAFVAEQRSRAAERARGYEAKGDLLSAYEEYRRAADEFAGLGDGADFAQRAEAMKRSPQFQTAEKQEREDIARQERLMGDIKNALVSLPAGSLEIRRRAEDIRQGVKALREQAERPKNARDARVLRRARADVFATAYEIGEAFLRRSDLTGAEVCFEIAGEARPESPGPPFELARLYAGSGQKKRALQALDRAIANGLGDAALLRETQEFASLRQDAHFQEILSRLGKSP
jgi:dienelactone hydrolase